MSAAVKDRRRKAVELRLAGATYEQIAEQVGYASKSSAHEAVAIALREAIAVPAQEMIEQESGRLDALMMAVWAAARDGDLQAVDRALRIMERRARLHGLDHADDLAARQVLLQEDQGRLFVQIMEASLQQLGALALARVIEHQPQHEQEAMRQRLEGVQLLDPMDEQVRSIVAAQLPADDAEGAA